MNENEISVKAVRTFQGDEGFKTPESVPFTVSRQRFADLKVNGLVEEAGAEEEKEAPKPENKAA
jgi:hypothetical protein